MIQIQRHIGFSTNLRVWLKSLDVVFDKTNGSPSEQVDFDDIDEDEVPTVAMRTMAIGDVRPQEQQE
jgi:hypothetical protein